MYNFILKFTLKKMSTMSGEKNLKSLLSNMSPSVSEKVYVFVCLPKEQVDKVFYELAIGMFVEKEGVTLIVTQNIAEARGWQYEGTFCCITLNVHSSLEAIGLTAVVSSALADKGISANVVAAYFHDHVFVPSDKKATALQALEALTRGK